jgi:hypothetical protein
MVTRKSDNDNNSLYTTFLNFIIIFLNPGDASAPICTVLATLNVIYSQVPITIYARTSTIKRIGGGFKEEGG